MDVVVRFTCSVKEQHFDVHFRPEEGKRAKITAIEAIQPQKRTVWDRFNPMKKEDKAQSSQTLDNIDFSRFCCPWCGTGKKKNATSGNYNTLWTCHQCGTNHCLGAWEVQKGTVLTCVGCVNTVEVGETGKKASLSGENVTLKLTRNTAKMITKD